MDDAVYFVGAAPIARLEGGNVYVEVTSGGRVFRFEGPISVFLETFAHFGEIAREWRVEQSGKVERIDQWRGEVHAASS